jgi:hypothetical protein
VSNASTGPSNCSSAAKPPELGMPLGIEGGGTLELPPPAGSLMTGAVLKGSLPTTPPPIGEPGAGKV